MYCKNCGKHLEEGTRFCDRCGQSVRKSGNSEQAVRHQNIEELKEERLNRKKRLAEKEAREEMKNRRKQKRRKQNRGIVVFMLVVVLIAVISVGAAYLRTREDSSININGEVSATSAPTSAVNVITDASPSTSASSAPSSSPAASGVSDPTSSEDYRVFEISNVECPYPSSFSKKAVSGNEKLSLVDSVGGAVMSISQEQGVSQTPAELMKEYAGTIGVNPSYSLADSNGYTITAEKGSTVYHRKCILTSHSAIYYDFQYSTSSSSESRYEQYIEYIDNNMIAK